MDVSARTFVAAGLDALSRATTNLLRWARGDRDVPSCGIPSGDLGRHGRHSVVRLASR